MVLWPRSMYHKISYGWMGVLVNGLFSATMSSKTGVIWISSTELSDDALVQLHFGRFTLGPILCKYRSPCVISGKSDSNWFDRRPKLYLASPRSSLPELPNPLPQLPFSRFTLSSRCSINPSTTHSHTPALSAPISTHYHIQPWKVRIKPPNIPDHSPPTRFRTCTSQSAINRFSSARTWKRTISINHSLSIWAKAFTRLTSRSPSTESQTSTRPTLSFPPPTQAPTWTTPTPTSSCAARFMAAKAPLLLMVILCRLLDTRIRWIKGNSYHFIFLSRPFLWQQSIDSAIWSLLAFSGRKKTLLGRVAGLAWTCNASCTSSNQDI